jgi:flagellar hook-basal body complex protein FliE
MTAMTAVQFLAPVIGAGAAMQSASPALDPLRSGVSFSSILQGQIAELDRTLKAAEVQSLKLASGEAPNLHQVMIGLEKARIAFQMTVQIRNRLMEGWQDLQRMQL